MQERRIPDIIVHYWEGKRANGMLFPGEATVVPEELEALGCWKDCFFIKVRDIMKETDYHYSYFGPSLVSAYGEDLTETSLRNFASPDAENLAEKYYEVIATKHPVTDESEFINARNMRVRYRQCLVPLGQGESVKAILGAMRYRLYPGG